MEINESDFGGFRSDDIDSIALCDALCASCGVDSTNAGYRRCRTDLSSFSPILVGHCYGRVECDEMDCLCLPCFQQYFGDIVLEDEGGDGDDVNSADHVESTEREKGSSRYSADHEKNTEREKDRAVTLQIM